MGSRRLVRDKLESDCLVRDNVEYRELLFSGLSERYTELQKIPNGKHKARAYELIADIVELTGCLNNQFLVAGGEVATRSRHAASMRTAKRMAEEEGGFFNGKVVEEQGE